MTPKDERILQKDREMARGREVQAHAARQDMIDRWRKAMKISYYIDETYRAYSEVRVYVGDQVVLRAERKTFPTEFDVARVGLAIRALANFDGVEMANPPPLPKSASALHVAETQRRLIEWELLHGKT